MEHTHNGFSLPMHVPAPFGVCPVLKDVDNKIVLEIDGEVIEPEQVWAGDGVKFIDHFAAVGAAGDLTKAQRKALSAWTNGTIDVLIDDMTDDEDEE